MKKKNGLKRALIKLDLEKIEIDTLSVSMLDGLQGGYQTQPGNTICECNTNPCSAVCSLWNTYCGTLCGACSAGC